MTTPITEDEHHATKLLADANEVARKFYRVLGYGRPKGYRFDKATHPQEQMCWLMVKIAVEHWFGTDLDEVADELEDDAS